MTLPTGIDPGERTPGICVIMAGGRGTRFWPLSRSDRPKQLLALASERSLLRETYERVEPLVGRERILVITSGTLAEPSRRELPELDPAHVVNEPAGRNTAPCAALGLALAARIDPAAPVALLPADHFIPDPAIFGEQLRTAFDLAARERRVITFGIRPDRPETGYGYLLTGQGPDAGGLLEGLGFVEKPDAATAEGYLQDGRYLWNGGIFVWNPEHFAAVAQREIPDIYEPVNAAALEFGTDGFAPALERAYDACPDISIDHAIMEKLEGFGVIEARFGWSDLGSWDAWGELAPRLDAANRGRGRIVALDSGDNVVMAPDKLTALVGVEDLIVVDTPDALLICRKDQAQRLKDVIRSLEASGRNDLL